MKTCPENSRQNQQNKCNIIFFNKLMDFMYAALQDMEQYCASSLNNYFN